MDLSMYNIWNVVAYIAFKTCGWSKKIGAIIKFWGKIEVVVYNRFIN